MKAVSGVTVADFVDDQVILRLLLVPVNVTVIVSLTPAMGCLRKS